MLVLGRKLMEGVVVDGPCRVVLVRVGRGHVRLGFEADPSVRILRDEVLARIESEKQKEAVGDA